MPEATVSSGERLTNLLRKMIIQKGGRRLDLDEEVELLETITATLRPRLSRIPLPHLGQQPICHLPPFPDFTPATLTESLPWYVEEQLKKVRGFFFFGPHSYAVMPDGTQKVIHLLSLSPKGNWEGWSLPLSTSHGSSDGQLEVPVGVSPLCLATSLRSQLELTGLTCHLIVCQLIKELVRWENDLVKKQEIARDLAMEFSHLAGVLELSFPSGPAVPIS